MTEAEDTDAVRLLHSKSNTVYYSGGVHSKKLGDLNEGQGSEAA